MTEIVVASIGGSGSRMLAEMLSRATGRTRCNDEFCGDWHGHILHTHLPYNDERDKLGSDWKAVHIIGGIGNAICSFYEERISAEIGFRLMGVKSEHIDKFMSMKEVEPIDAWEYILDGDKLRWCTNIKSWRFAPNTLPVRYEALCADPHGVCNAISEHIGFDVPVINIVSRKSNWKRLPGVIQKSIEREYTKLKPYGITL